MTFVYFFRDDIDMYSHSPEINKTKVLPNIDAASTSKNNKERSTKPSKKDNYSNLKRNDSVPLSPLKSLPRGLHKKDSCDLQNMDKEGVSSCSKNRDKTRTDNTEFLRSESFSKYKPLPAISNETDSKTKASNKRTFETWTSQEQCTESSSSKQENDEFLLETIKKMKLGTDNSLVNIEQVYSQTKRNPFQKVKIKEKTKEERLASTSSINLIIRLPDGERVKHSFSSSDTLGCVIEYLTKIMDRNIELKKYVIYTNEVPKRELKENELTLVALGVQDKSVLALDTRDIT